MPLSLEEQFKDLLNPVKDPEKSFAVDIACLLVDFVTNLINGRESYNFNSAALVIQGSASVYGRKVEYLHNLTTGMHQSLLRKTNQHEAKAKKDTNKEKKDKKKENKYDWFQSIEIKRSKRLSCLKKKNNLRSASKKKSKKKKKEPLSRTNIHFLAMHNAAKGRAFYDTQEELVGNQGDFVLNGCRINSAGWLMFSTVNPNLAVSLEPPPDSDDDDDISPVNQSCEASDDFEPIQGSPDEGFGSCPQSSDQQASPDTIQATPDCQEINMNSSSTDPTPIDEGIGDTPNLDTPNLDTPNLDSPGTENAPADDAEEDPNAPQPVRKSVRRVLKTCQLAIEADALGGVILKKELLMKNAVQKKNVRRIPAKLKENAPPPPPLIPISLFCARAFLSVQDNVLMNSLLKFETEGFDQNGAFMKLILEKFSALKTSHKKNKNIAPVEDEKINIEDLENTREANEDDETLHIPFDDNDIQVDHEHGMPSNHPPRISLPADNQILPPEVDLPDISQVTHEENENYLREVFDFVHNSDITERVHEWERTVKPFLGAMEARQSFDINLYGSEILNSFADSNRKQTKTFRELCRGKEKWEIHRYFMALLPLANMGNVELGKEKNPDGTEKIFVTLLSRKMHHKELEEFGHTEGEHS